MEYKLNLDIDAPTNLKPVHIRKQELDIDTPIYKNIDLIVMDKEVKKQVDVAKEFLQILIDNKFVQDARVMGGAPRDWYFNRRARDIDVFCSGLKINSLCASVPDIAMIRTDHRISKSSYTFQVWNTSWKDEVIQLINIGGPDKYIPEYMDTFDFGLNMISMDCEGMVEITKFFEHDYTNNKLTFYPKMMSFNTFKKIYERFEKMSLKYPGFSLDMRPNTYYEKW